MLEIVSLVGMAIILASWAMTFTKVLQKNRELDRNFVGLYTLGLVILTIGGANRGLDFMAILNILTVIISLLLYLRLRN